MISTLDTHELVKDLKASGFTDEQAEAVTRAVRLAQEIDLSNLTTKADLVNFATKTDIADLRREITELTFASKTDIADLRREITAVELRLIKWVIGVGIAAVLAVGGMIFTATNFLLHAHA